MADIKLQDRFTVGQLRNLQVAPVVAPPVVQQKPGLLGEFVRGTKSALLGVPAGVGQLAADLPGIDQGNALQRYGQEGQAANASGIQSFSDILDRPAAAFGAATGNAVGSVAGMLGARAAGTAITAAAPLTGPLAPITAGIGQAIANYGPVASLVARGFGGIRQQQIAQDPANTEDLGAKLLAGAGGVVSAAVERLGGGERLAGAFLRGGRAGVAREVGGGTLLQAVARSARRGAVEEFGEELLQGPIEQVASFQNPLTPDSLKETAFQATMGAIGGGGVGAGFGLAARQKPPVAPPDLTNEDLARSVDGVILGLPAPGQTTPNGFTVGRNGATLDAAALANHRERVQALRQAGRYAEADQLDAAVFGVRPQEQPLPPLQAYMVEPPVEPVQGEQLQLPAPPPPDRTLVVTPEGVAAPRGAMEFAAASLEAQRQQAMADIEARAVELEQAGQPEAAIALRSQAIGLGAQPVVPPIQTILAANPTVSLRGAPPAVRQALAAATTPEEVAAVAAREYHTRMARDTGKRGTEAPKYVTGESGLQALYRAATGQEMPSRDEYEAQQVAQAVQAPAAPAPVVPPTVAPQVAPVVQAPAAPAPVVPTTVAPQVAPTVQAPAAPAPVVQAAPQVAPTVQAIQGTQPDLGIPSNLPTAETRRQARVKEADQVALAALKRDADVATTRILDEGDTIGKGERRRLENTISKYEAAQAEFEAKYAPRASRATAQPAGPHTVTTIREAISRAIGRAAMTRLAKRFVIVADSAALQTDMDRRGSDYAGRVDGTEKGLYDPSTQTSYIIASNMAATDSPWGVFLHEVGTHYGLTRLLGKKGHSSVLRDVNRLLREGDPALAAAARQVNQAEQLGLDPNTPDFATQFADRILGDSRLGEETIAYMAENPASHNRAVWKRIVTAVRNFLRSLGVTRPITSDDIAVMVIAAARKAVDTAQAPTGQRTTMVQDAQDVLAQFGYTARTAQDGTVDILDANGQVVPDEQIADSAQLAAAIVKYPEMRGPLGQDIADMGPMASRSVGTGPVSPDTQATFDAYGKAVDAARGLAARAIGTLTKNNRDSWSAKALRVVVRWATRGHLVEMYDDRFNGALKQNADTYANQEVVGSRLNQLFNSPYHKLEALEKGDPTQYERITKVMTATEFHMDPRKTWEAQKHLHTGTAEEQAAAKARLAGFRQAWGLMSKDSQQIYSDLVAMNETMYIADMAVSLQNLVRAQVPENLLPQEFRGDVTEAFRNDPTTHESIAAAKSYWEKELQKFMAAAEKYSVQQRGQLPKAEPNTPEYLKAVREALKGVPEGKERDAIRARLRRAHAPGLTPEQSKIVRHLSQLEAQVKVIEQGLTGIQQAPYFHLGRFGDYFVGFKVKLAKGGTADPTAMRAISEALGKDFPDVVLRADATDPTVYARFESVDTAQRFKDALSQLQAQGFIEPGDNRNGYFSGVKSQANSLPVGPKWLNDAIESISTADYGADEAGQKVVAQLIADLRTAYLDSLPNLSSAKVLAHRKGRQGYSADMIRSYAHRTWVASSHIAGLAVEPQRRASMQQIEATLRELQGTDIAVDEQNKLRIIADEFKVRDAENVSAIQTPALSMIRSLGHTFFLGLSPAYVLSQVTQIGALAWPEFTKRHGAVKSFNALTRATPAAFKVVQAAFREGLQARGIKGAADMVITADTLRAAGLPPDVATYIIEVMGTGKLDIGNATREIARVAQGEISGPNSAKINEVLRVATITSYASEIFTRTVVALAARDLNGVKGAVPYAAQVLDQAMLNYNQNNIGRATGKTGIFGPVTPAVFQFHQYQFQVLEKLYREVYRATGIGRNVTPEQTAEARRFLKSHATAMTVLAGTMGLPFMTVAARLTDALCELFSDQPCDSQASLRNFTTDVLGPDLEPIVSRGVLRAVGGDMVGRIGEQDLLPGSNFLADRRTLAEKLKHPTISVSGASGSMLASLVEGAQLMADGDWWGGAQRAVPLAIQGPMKAYSLATQGFTDKNKNTLPMTPHATEILGQLLGIQPGQKADYSQAARSQSQRTAILTRELSLIRRNLAVAVERQDREMMLTWGRRAMQFQQANPGIDIMQGVSSSLQQRARARALGEYGILPGANPRDIGVQASTRFFQPGAQ